jgi:hypothetical protein
VTPHEHAACASRLFTERRELPLTQPEIIYRLSFIAIWKEARCLAWCTKPIKRLGVGFHGRSTLIACRGDTDQNDDRRPKGVRGMTGPLCEVHYYLAERGDRRAIAQLEATVAIHASAPLGSATALSEGRRPRA